MSLNIYGYAGCTTVKKAITWAEQNGLAPQYSHFAKLSDLESHLRIWVDKAGIDAVFNDKAQTFIKLDAQMRQTITASTQSKIAAMATDPRLIKRPVGTNGKTVLAGFVVDDWKNHFTI